MVQKHRRTVQSNLHIGVLAASSHLATSFIASMKRHRMQTLALPPSPAPRQSLNIVCANLQRTLKCLTLCYYGISKSADIQTKKITRRWARREWDSAPRHCCRRLHLHPRRLSIPFSSYPAETPAVAHKLAIPQVPVPSSGSQEVRESCRAKCLAHACTACSEASSTRDVVKLAQVIGTPIVFADVGGNITKWPPLSSA